MNGLGPKVQPIHVDWYAYYNRFKQEHGDPVKYRGRLLFKDGWMYSATDPVGPEWPPPTTQDEVKLLALEYWTRRKAIVVEEYEALKTMVDNLENLQKTRNVPLQVRISVQKEMDDGSTQRLTEYTDIDTTSIRAGRLAWLEEDIRDCTKQIEECKKYYQILEKPLPRVVIEPALTS